MLENTPDFRTAATLPATGQVVPDYTEIVTSPDTGTAQQPTGGLEHFMPLGEFITAEPASSQNSNGNGEAAVAASSEAPTEETIAATGWLARAREGLHQGLKNGLKTGKEWVANRRAGIAYTVGVAALYGAGHYGKETLNELDVSPSLGGVINGSIGVLGSEHVVHTGAFAVLSGVAFLAGLVMRDKSPKAGRTRHSNASLSELMGPSVQDLRAAERQDSAAYMDYCNRLITQSNAELEDLQRSVEGSLPEEFKTRTTTASLSSMPEAQRANILSVVDKDFIAAAEEMLRKEGRMPEHAQNGYESKHALIPA